MDNEEMKTSLFGDIGDDKEFRERYGELIGAGMTAAIYARDGIAAKVYRVGQRKAQVFMEAYTMAAVSELDIPVPQIYGVEIFNGRTALLMDLVQGDSLLDTFLKKPEKTGECLDLAVRLQTTMHTKRCQEFVSLKKRLEVMITGSPGLTPEEKDRLLTDLSQLPDGSSICHGDFHCGNILYDGTVIRIIDWAEVSSGNPAGDACRSYLDYSLSSQDICEMYLDKYMAASGIKRDEILAWLPVTAGSLYGYFSDEAKKRIRKFF
jgi:aminoglycoside phosphotransferase